MVREGLAANWNETEGGRQARVIVLSHPLLWLFSGALVAPDGAAGPMPASPVGEATAGAADGPAYTPEMAAGVVAGQELAQLVIEERVIIRVPMQRHGSAHSGPARRAPPPPAPPGGWREEKGPHCIAIRKVRGAAITSAHGVDLLLAGRERLRARLGRECRAADFYSGFYIRPSADGTLCAGRDRILSRSGMDCEIVAIRRLVPGK